MTGKMGLVRNLTASEILSQVFFARQAVKENNMVSFPPFKHRTCAQVLDQHMGTKSMCEHAKTALTEAQLLNGV